MIVLPLSALSRLPILDALALLADVEDPPWRELADELRALRQELRPAVVEDPWLTVEEVARRLGRHADTIRADLRAGRLPGARLGRVWRIRADSLADLEADHVRQRRALREDRARVEEASDWLKAQARERRAKRRR